MPLWPEGFTGSLTHTDGLRAAVAASTRHVHSMGLDAEPAEPLPDGVLRSIASETEIAMVKRLQADGYTWADRLLFCAKEATYKAWFPITGRWLGFEDAHITFEQTGPASGTFVSRILIDPAASDGGAPLLELPGRWLIERDLITTTIALV